MQWYFRRLCTWPYSGRKKHGHYHYLRLDKLDCCVAIIKNAKSNKMGKKDIMKIECPIDVIDLDILGFIDHNITINIIQDEKIVEKKRLKLPKEITNVTNAKILAASLLLSRNWITCSCWPILKTKYTAANIVKKSIADNKDKHYLRTGWLICHPVLC